MDNIRNYTAHKKMYHGLKHLILRESLIETNNINDFYVTHTTVGGEEVLYKILRDGYLRPGKDVEHAHILSASDLENIYANINFSDINNVGILGNVSIQFHPQLMYDYGIIFNRGWFAFPYESSIWIHKTDTYEEKWNKLQQIKEYLKNPTFYPKFLTENAGYMAHEIMIDGAIPLEKYMISINCMCSKKYTKKIKDIIKSKYPRVKILNCVKDKFGLCVSPSLKDIIDS